MAISGFLVFAELRGFEFRRLPTALLIASNLGYCSIATQARNTSATVQA
jgi:hypothetical protein